MGARIPYSIDCLCGAPSELDNFAEFATGTTICASCGNKNEIKYTNIGAIIMSKVFQKQAEKEVRETRKKEVIVARHLRYIYKLESEIITLRREKARDAETIKVCR